MSGLSCSAPAMHRCFPSGEIRRAFVEAGIGLEPMATGAAVRTYNVLLQEGRDVACALIAVEHHRSRS